MGSAIAAPATPLVAASPATYLSRYRNAHSAFAAWARSGGTLVIDRDAEITRPVTAVLRPGYTYRIVTSGNRRLTYQGPAFHWALRLVGTGRNRVGTRDLLTIDGARRVSMPLYALFDRVSGASRADFLVDGLTCHNAQMSNILSPVDRKPLNIFGATGMMYQGGFDRLTLRNVAVRNVRRSARSGVKGSRGCAGIGVLAKMGTTKSARHILVEDFAVSSIDSSDAYSSSKRGDMDGLTIFQSAETSGTRPVVRRGEIVNAAGRGIKIYAPGGGGLTENISIARSRPAGPDGGIDVQHQHGDGTIRNIYLSYSGDAHRNPTTCVGMTSNSKRSARFPFGPGVINNIQIRDTTRVMKHAIVGLHYYIVGDRTPRRFSISNVSDNGTANTLLLPGVLGRDGPMELALSDIDVDLKSGLLASEDRTPGFAIDVRGPVSLSDGMRSVPLKVDYANRRVSARLDVPVRGRERIRGLRR